MPVGLYLLRDEVGEFLKAVDPSGKEPVARIVSMLDEEYAELKASLSDRTRLSHQIYDMLFLLLELASKENLDLDGEWEKGPVRKRKCTMPRAGELLENGDA